MAGTPRFILIDDGTLDTVFQCERCKTWHRFHFDGESDDYTYDDFVHDCREELERDGCQTCDGD